MSDDFYRQVEKQDAEQDAEQLAVAEQDVAKALLKHQLSNYRKTVVQNDQSSK